MSAHVDHNINSLLCEYACACILCMHVGVCLCKINMCHDHKYECHLAGMHAGLFVQIVCIIKVIER